MKMVSFVCCLQVSEQKYLGEGLETDDEGLDAFLSEE